MGRRGVGPVKVLVVLLLGLGVLEWLDTLQSTVSASSADTQMAQAVARTTGLTVDQAARLIDIEPDVDRLRTWIEERYPDASGGVWMDILDKGRVKVALTEDSPRDEILDFFPYPEILDVVPVEHPLYFLEGLKSTIGDDADELRAEGVDLTGVFVDLPKNQVTVGVSNPTQSSPVFEERYPDAPLTIIYESPPNEAACTVRGSNCTPYRGGIQLWSTEASCSASFAYSWGSTNDPPDGLITAGHCFDFGTPAIFHGSTWYGNIPTGGYDKFAGSVDGALVDEVGWLPDDTAPRLFRDVDYKWWPIYGSANLSKGGVGSAICHSSVRRDYQCGTITNESYDFWYGITRFTDFRRDNICTLPGDSGGAIFQASTAHGIINFSNFVDDDTCASTPRTTYTQIYYVERDFGIQVSRAP